MQPPESPLPPQQRYAVPVPVFVGVVLLLTLAFICGLGVVGVIPSIRGLKSPISIATIPPPRAMATLGGTLGDFTQRYGNSTDDSGLSYTATLAGQRVRIVVALDDASQSGDGQEHVIAIDVQPPSDALGVETWDATTADAIAHFFLPVDAQLRRTVTINGDTYHIYFSDAMAAIMMPGQYTNAPGSLNYYCHAWPPSATATDYGQCHIAIGTGVDAN